MLRWTLIWLTCTLVAMALSTTPASASSTRELIGTFGPAVDAHGGIAVDLETGNVYVTDPESNMVDVFGPMGGAPVGGVPDHIDGLPAGALSDRGEPELNAVAVDNSCDEHEPRLTGAACEEYDPRYGDVYVTDRSFVGGVREEGIDEFKLNTSTNEYQKIAKLLLTGQSPPNGVAVDSRGDVMGICEIGGPEYTFEIFAASGEVKTYVNKLVRRPGYITASDPSTVYLGETYSYKLPGPGVAPPVDNGIAKLQLGPAEEVLSEEIVAPTTHTGIYSPLAYDHASDGLIVGVGDHVAEYGASGGLRLEFGSSEPGGGSFVGFQSVTAVAVNDVSERTYVVNSSDREVDVFGPVVGPPVVPVEQPSVSDVQRTSVLVAGVADPEGSNASYRYEYVPAGEFDGSEADPYAEGGRTGQEPLPTARVDEAIERTPLTGLTPGTTYHYRLAATNSSGTAYGPDETFTTAPATPPVAVTGIASGVGVSSATLSGVVEPRGLPTSYVFEVGTDTGYGGAKLYGEAGEGTGSLAVSVDLQYLVPDMTYHYRLVAKSFDGVSYGQDMTFTTPQVPAPPVQPASVPLLAIPNVQFPSIAGAVTKPVQRHAVKHAHHGRKKRRASRRRKKRKR